MRFELPRGKAPKDHKELKHIPEFSKLTEMQFRFVQLSTDPDSPWFIYPDRVRRKKAALAAGYKMEDNRHNSLDMNGRNIIAGKIDYVEEAMLKYKEFVTIDMEEDREMIEVVQTQIDNIKLMAKKGSDDPAELKKINDLIKDLPNLRQTMKDLRVQSGMTIASDVTDDQPERELSEIDKVNIEQIEKEDQ